MQRKIDRVVLINPPISQEITYGKFASGAPVLPPLGILYLAAYLLKHGYDVRVIDGVAEHLSLDGIIEELSSTRDQVIGITATTVAYWAAKQLIEKIRSEISGSIVVLGGAHVSGSPEKTIVELPEGTYAIRGEGETAFLRFIHDVERGGDFNDVPSLIYKEDGKIFKTERAPLIKDIDSLPHPARHLLVSPDVYSHTMFRGWKQSISVITSRGCPFQCSYCDQSVFQRSWRAHSPDYIIDELKEIFETYGPRFVSFEDDNFFLNKKRMTEFCTKVIEQRLHFHWGCSLRLTDLSEEYIPLMYQAGCRLIYVGLESGVDRIKKMVNKDIDRDEIYAKIKLVKKYGIRIYASFILGIPTETKAEMKETVRFARSLALDGVSFFLFTPFHNIQLSELAHKHGRVNTDYKYFSAHTDHPVYIPEGMTAKELLKIQKRAYFFALAHRRFIRQNLRNLFTRKMLKQLLDVVRR